MHQVCHLLTSLNILHYALNAEWLKISLTPSPFISLTEVYGRLVGLFMHVVPELQVCSGEFVLHIVLL